MASFEAGMPGVMRAAAHVAASCATALTLACAEPPAPAAPATDGPHVVLITLDALRRDHLSYFGYERPTSPNIDWLASHGLGFSNVVPTGCSTKISLTSLFTSLDHRSHAVSYNRDELPDESVTLAEAFAAAGYATAGFVASPWVARSLNYDQGFEVYEDFSDSEVRFVGAERVAGAAMGFVRGRPPQDARPFFLYLHLKEPHPPWEHGSPWLDEPEPSSSFFDKSCIYVPHPDEIDALGETKRRNLVAKYDGAIKYADDWIGVLLATLRSLGVMDRTVIAVSTDHGIELADRYSASHRAAPFDPVLKSFLVLYDGRSHLDALPDAEVQARIFDIGPTLLALAGVDAPADLEGIDLLGESPALPELAFSSCWRSQVVQNVDYRLIRVRQEAFAADEPPRTPPFPKVWNLVDRAAEADAGLDVSASRPAVFARMQRALTAYEVRADEERDLTPEEIAELDSVTRERLQALGYIE